MFGQAYVFLRVGGAQGLGHVGWAFLAEDGCFNAGAVENPGGFAYAPAGKGGFWTDWVGSPVSRFASACPYDPYDRFQVVMVPEANPLQAWKTVRWLETQPYCVVGRNCMDAVYDVLRAYGMNDLPPPSKHWNPNQWYLMLEGEYHKMGEPFGLDDPIVQALQRRVWEIWRVADFVWADSGALPEARRRAEVHKQVAKELIDLAGQRRWPQFKAQAEVFVRMAQL